MKGVSANILMGKPIKGGTGAFDLLLDSDMLKTENAQPQRGLHLRVPPPMFIRFEWLHGMFLKVNFLFLSQKSQATINIKGQIFHPASFLFFQAT